MPKRRTTLKFDLPEYESKKNTRSSKWRKAINEVAFKKSEEENISYNRSDHLRLLIHLYLAGNAVIIHDVDNRLKDIMDALQGSLGGNKSKKRKNPIIPNDNQIYRVVIEKSSPPKQNKKSGGKIEIRKFRHK